MPCCLSARREVPSNHDGPTDTDTETRVQMPNYADIRDRAYIVTGAAGGIGGAVTERLIAESARVLAVDTHADGLRALEARLGDRCVGVRADVSSADDVQRYVTLAIERFGRLDGAHLNAGYPGLLAPLAETDIDDFDRVMAVNLRGVYLGLRFVLRELIERATGGAIVVTASSAALGGAQQWGPYAASKHGTIGLVKTAALEYARAGIRVNAVCPGVTDTAMVRTGDDPDGAGDAAARAAFENILPVGRYAQPSEIAESVVWLLSDASSYVTGAALSVDGGQTASCANYLPA